ncbi:MAG: T9SS type A sorting domain-containing protein [Candidatus Fermentibacteraceae bacterium]|nr:T9SS type A sorting domain-containing protein [Candidatus Fermentibacteraceae bacterium]
MNILLILIIGYTYPQAIDMVAIDDTLFIAMESSNQVVLYRYESTTLIEELELEGFYNNVSIGYSSEAAEPYGLLVCSYMMGMKGEQDTLFAFCPDNLSLLWKTGNLPCPQYVDPYMQSRFVDRWISPTRDPRLIGYFCTHVTDASDDQWIFSYTFNTETEPTSWSEYLYREEYIDQYVDDYFFGPVQVGEEPPVTSIIDSDGMIPYHSWWVEFQIHEPESDSLMRIALVSEGFWDINPPDYPRGYCLGSCSDFAIMFWSDTTSTVLSAKLSGSPLETVSIDTVTYSFPNAGSHGIAASRHPYDSGVLLAYYSEGYIRARYMEDDWFTDEYQITPSDPVTGGNITVCSTTEGFWIAWNDGNDYPNIAWVGRETWTGISDDESTDAVRVNLTAEPNPFRGICELSVNPCDVAIPIHIYDSSGRYVHSGSTDADGTYIWNAQSMPSGLYFIQVFQNDNSIGGKVLLIQ